MPDWYFPLSTFFVRRPLLVALLAVLVIGGFVAIAVMPDLNPRLRNSAFAIWWFVLAIIWFDERKKEKISVGQAWINSLALDFFGLVAAALIAFPHIGP